MAMFPSPDEIEFQAFDVPPDTAAGQLFLI